jgi:hypothetical protein
MILTDYSKAVIFAINCNKKKIIISKYMTNNKVDFRNFDFDETSCHLDS